MPAQQRTTGQGSPTAGTDVERRTELIQFAGERITQYRQHFINIAPKHIDPGAFVDLALGYVKQSADLLTATQANPASLILALRECAAKGHMPIRGTFVLTPFRDSKAPGGWSIVGMEEWRGVVARMYRSGGVASVHVNVGRDNDPVLEWNPTEMLLPKHKYDAHASRQERGPLKSVYAWARLSNGGTSDVVYLNRHEVARHRSMSKSIKAEGGGNFWGPPWPEEGTNTEAMWRKTALHVLEGLVPTSPEYMHQVALAEAAARSWPGVPDQPVPTAAYPDDIQDAELVSDGDRP